LIGGKDGRQTVRRHSRCGRVQLGLPDELADTVAIVACARMIEGRRPITISAYVASASSCNVEVGVAPGTLVNTSAVTMSSAQPPMVST
jgi:hypothetical protein